MGTARGVALSLVLALAASLASQTAFATDHFVRVGATGAGSGADWTNAWSSFDAMDWSKINPGDTVYLAGGTYGMLAIIKSGTAGSPITFKRATVAGHGTAPGWNNAYDAQVVIDGGGNLGAIGFGECGDWAGHSYVTIDGATRYGIKCRNAMYGVRADRGPTNDNITLRYLELGDAGAYKLGEDGIQGTGDNLTVEYCFIHDDDNIQTHGDGVQWFRGNNLTFRYNVFMNVGQLFMLTEIWSSTNYDYVDNLNIYYNVFYNRSGTHYDGIKWKLAPRAGFSWRIYNNTFDLDAPTNPGDWEDRVMAGPASPNIDFRNNAVTNSRFGSIGDNSHSFNGYDNGGAGAIPDLPTPLVETGAVLAADLGFVNSGGADWHLISTSPLIGKGASVGLSVDFDGKAVPATPSIGAFEYTTVVATPPSITSQPASKTVSAGQTATFSVTVSGSAPLTYQWQKNGVAIGGANGASYTTPATSHGDSGAAFRVVVSNSAGSVTSSAAILTVVNVPPTITSAASAAPNPALVAQAVTFSVAASNGDGDPLTYAWNFGDGASGSGASATHAYSAAGTFNASVTVIDGFGGSASSSVSVAANVAAVSQTLLTTQQPLILNNTDGANANYELGTRFKSDTGGQITAIRFWKASRETGTHTGHLWSAAGTLLATVTFANETASGWQEQSLNTPVTIAANSEYLVSVNTGGSYYVSDDMGFSKLIVNGHLSSIVGGNGRYGAPGKYPTSTWMSSNYFRDLRFVPASTAVAAALAPDALTVTHLSGAAKLSARTPGIAGMSPRTGRDSVAISGTLSGIPAGFAPKGQTFSLSIGGASATFVLDARGHGKSSSGAVALKVSGTSAKFSAKLARGTWAATWGMDPAQTTSGAALPIEVDADLGALSYSTAVAAKCSAKAGTSGKLTK